MFGTTNPSKSDRTKIRYRHTVDLLSKRFYRETGLFAGEHPRRFAAWFEDRIPHLAASTLRYYRAALLYVLEPTGPHGVYKRFTEMDSRNAKPKANKLKTAERRTTQKKRRGVPLADAQKVVNAIDEKPKVGYWLNVGRHVFAATYYTGLRPIEWSGAQLVTFQNQCWLRVRNAKQGNGRAHGAYRHISLEQFSDELINLIEATIAICASSLNAHGRWIPPEEFCKQFSGEFSRHSRRVFKGRKRTIPIYCARHQFAANLKATRYTRITIAALMGHASDTTAFRHYLAGRWGHRGGPLPVPVPEEAARVRQVAKPNPHTTEQASKGASGKLTSQTGPTETRAATPSR